jgi:hypothetical protein
METAETHKPIIKKWNTYEYSKVLWRWCVAVSLATIFGISYGPGYLIKTSENGCLCGEVKVGDRNAYCLVL